MDISQYMGMFLEESREHLQTLNNCLLDLENDPGSLSVLDEIFRSAHTIKGMSATMGFTTIAELTHEMENVLDLLRKGTLQANDAITDTLFKCVDTLEQLVESVASNSDNTIDIKPLIAKLIAIAKGEFAASKTQLVQPAINQVDEETNSTETIKLDDTEINVVKAAKKQGIECYQIQVTLRTGCLLKSARAYMVMNALEELGEVIKSIPAVEELEKENFDHTFQVVILTGVDSERIENTVLGISEVENAVVVASVISESKQKSPQNTTVQSETSNIIQSDKKDIGNKSEKSSSEHVHLADKKLKSGQSVRVDIDKLDSLLNLVGELVINKTRLEQIGLTHRLVELVETIEQMDRVTTDLQAVV
ncbi:MAG: cheA, partial [Sporomusa sp.]|nr:cheA [Sporomusa sp.]